MAAGMNIYAAIFLIPFTVVLYTSSGGLKVGIKLTMSILLTLLAVSVNNMLLQHSNQPHTCFGF